ncbi:MAG: flavin-containing monooxygenase [Rhizobiaceae bacterium]
MSIEAVNTLVVGAGQAGIAMSEHLGSHGITHVVLERAHIADRWHNGRWDSLVANGPAWHDRFPGRKFNAVDQDSFVPKEQVAAYFEAYAKDIDAPVRCGVDVLEVQRQIGKSGFLIKTSAGTLEAQNVVAATGAFQHPIIPAIIPDDAGVTQIHSIDYCNPDQLPAGAVMVVGAGSSGVQIAQELQRAGRSVYLCVGPHDRPPRRYRGRDNVWWLGVLGLWDAAALAPGKERFTICVSGADGGKTVDFRRLAGEGITLLGMAQTYDGGVLSIARDLTENIAVGDASYLAMLDLADQYVIRNGLDLPLESEARMFEGDPDCVTNPLLSVELKEAGINSVVWATGFSQDFGWLKVDTFDEAGNPLHRRGVGAEAGIFFLGLPWQTRRASSFIWGVWHDAKEIADHIAQQNNYLNYHAEADEKLS